MSKIEDAACSIVYGTADRELLNSNANKDSTRVPVMKNLVAGEVAKAMAYKTLPPNVITAHRDGVIHFHDMDESPFYPMYNCCLVDLKNMLDNGFTMGNAEIETPKSIETACAVTAQIVAQVASHQYGGVSMNRLDEILAPYVDKSYNKHLEVGKNWMNDAKAEVYAADETRKEVYNACQGLEYEVNTLFTSQG